MPGPRFSEQKLTEATVYLLSLSGGRLNYLKLIKLLYYADRAAFQAWERPITYDSYVSMKNGPVLSMAYDLIKGSNPIIGDFWNRYIVTRRYEVHKKGELPRIQKLSRAEMDLLREIHQKYAKYNPWQLRDMSHKLPEYRDPHGSSLSIPISEILAALGNSSEDIERILAELNEEASIAAMFGD